MSLPFLNSGKNILALLWDIYKYNVILKNIGKFLQAPLEGAQQS